MQILIRAHGPAKGWLGQNTLTLDLPEASTVADAVAALPLPQAVAVACGDTLLAPSTVLVADQCLELIPPVSGG
jgi:sulfur carrier protein ThiS